MAQQVNDQDPTIGKLVSDASRDLSSLVQKEIQLAKSELKVSVQAGGIGIGLFAGAAFVAGPRDHHALGVVRLLHQLERQGPRLCTGRS